MKIKQRRVTKRGESRKNKVKIKQNKEKQRRKSGERLGNRRKGKSEESGGSREEAIK